MEKVLLNNIVEFQKKSTIKAGSGLALNEGKYPFFTSSNSLSKSLNEFLFEGESLIFGTGGQASIHFCSDKFAVSTDCFVTQIKNKEDWNTKFIYHFLSGNIHLLENGFKGAGLKHISKEYLKSILIPKPPLHIQKAIAAKLDKAQEIISYNQQLLEKYDQLTQSLFIDMFGDPVKNEMGWEVKNLGNITHLITDGKHGNCSDEPGSGYYFISAKDVRNNKINYTNSREIPKKEFEEVDKRTNLQSGDLVMINTGATIGRMAIALDIPETRRSTFQKSVAIIKVKKDIISSFFLQYVLELGLETFANMGSGSAIKNLLLSEMRRFKIIIPDLNLQNQFAERIAQIEIQKTMAQESLAKSEQLFQSLLKESFK